MNCILPNLFRQSACETTKDMDFSYYVVSCFFPVFPLGHVCVWPKNDCNIGKPKKIPTIHPVVPAECIQIEAAFFPDGVAVEPAVEAGGVEAVAVVVETGFGVVVLRAETMREVAGHWR